MLVCAVTLAASDRLHAWLGDQVVTAMEKLMGLVLTAVALWGNGLYSNDYDCVECDGQTINHVER